MHVDRGQASPAVAAPILAPALLAAVLIGVVCLAGACAAESRSDSEQAAPTRRSVRCAAVEMRQTTDHVDLRGTVQTAADRRAQVAAQVEGRILRVLVREGDRVRAGQLVAALDTAPALDQVHDAEAAVGRAQAERANAETTLARARQVFDRGIAARQEVDDAAAHLAAARAGEAEAATALTRAQRQVDRAAVRSPLDGVVLRVLKRPGELVDATAATAVVDIGDPSRLELVADVPASQLVQITRGATVKITLDALPQREWPGTVSLVSPSVDAVTGLGTVRIALALGSQDAPPIGLYGIAHVDSGRARSAIVVPRAALRSGENAQTEVVVCGADGLAHVLAVQRGTDLGEFAVIDGPVKAGDKVAIEPVVGLAEGDQLEVRQ